MSTILNQYLNCFGFSSLSRMVQGCPLVIVQCVHIGSLLNELKYQIALVSFHEHRMVQRCSARIVLHFDQLLSVRYQMVDHGSLSAVNGVVQGCSAAVVHLISVGS